MSEEALTFSTGRSFSGKGCIGAVVFAIRDAIGEIAMRSVT